MIIAIFIAVLIFLNLEHIKKILFGKNMQKKDIQFCPKCGSTKFRESNIVPLGDPILRKGFYGWDCLQCKYTGKDFLIVSKEKYKNVYDKKFAKSAKLRK